VIDPAAMQMVLNGVVCADRLARTPGARGDAYPIEENAAPVSAWHAAAAPDRR
jgi:hypothetical protein